jgi:ribonuclease T1
MVMSRRQHPLIWIAALLAIAIGTYLQRDRNENPAQVPQPAPSQESAQARAQAPRIDNVVRDAEERAELQKTLDLIARGGPFPYPNDGRVFGNRERRLPQHEAGYYREYTVVTPGSPDRGARRVVRGNRGEMYYTRDHYRTFTRIDR